MHARRKWSYAAYVLVALQLAFVARVLVGLRGSAEDAHHDAVAKSPEPEGEAGLAFSAVKDRPFPAYVEAHLATLSKSERDKCARVLRGKSRAWSQANQDIVLWDNVFWRLPAPGVFLDIGANHAEAYSNTFMFDKCLGWKGVSLEPNPFYNQSYVDTGRRTRVVNRCVSTRDGEVLRMDFAQTMWASLSRNDSVGTAVECISLSALLERHADILGERDDRGAWGGNINFVSLDVEGFESNLLGCADLRGLFSSRPSVQAWVIEMNNLHEKQLRTVDASMTWAGYAKVFSLFENSRSKRGGTFLDDLFLMQRQSGTGTLGAARSPLYKCRNGQPTCALIHVMALDRIDATC